MTFRETRGDAVLSGPMYYLRDGFRSPALALDLRAGRRRSRR